MAPAVATYAPRDPSQTVLYKVIAEHLETFLASCQHFAEPVVRLMRALCTLDTGVWQTHAAELAAVGHSSGVDAMVGIALGCRLLVPRFTF